MGRRAISVTPVIVLVVAPAIWRLSIGTKPPTAAAQTPSPGISVTVRSVAAEVVPAFLQDVDPATGTSHLKARFDNQNERLSQNDPLWTGEFVNVRVVLSVRKGVATVPPRTATADRRHRLTDDARVVPRLFSRSRPAEPRTLNKRAGTRR
jgi:hypothetical protein